MKLWFEPLFCGLSHDEVGRTVTPLAQATDRPTLAGWRPADGARPTSQIHTFYDHRPRYVHTPKQGSYYVDFLLQNRGGTYAEA